MSNIDNEYILKKAKNACENIENELNNYLITEEYLNLITFCTKLEGIKDYKTALKILYFVYGKSLKENNTEFICESLKEISIISRIDKKYSESLKILDEAWKYSIDISGTIVQSNILGNYGILAMLSRNYREAIIYHNKALVILENQKDKKRIIPNKSFIGVNYLFLNDSKNAVLYIMDACKIAKQIDYYEGIADSQYNLALYYYKKYEHNHVITILSKALLHYLEIRNIYKVLLIIEMFIRIKDCQSNESINTLNNLYKKIYSHYSNIKLSENKLKDISMLMRKNDCKPLANIDI
jgi:hypothetical protein